MTVETTFSRDAIAAIESIKTTALSLGVQIDDAVLYELGGPDRLTVHEYPTTGGITVVLPGDVYVNAPFDEPFCAESGLRLVDTGEGLALTLDDLTVRVERVLPLPGYLQERDSHGRLVEDTVMSHADRIRISPIEGCAFNCDFCDLATLKYQPRPAEQLCAAIDVALRDEALPPRHLLISGGSPGLSEAQQRYFEDTCRTVVEHLAEATAEWPEPFEVDIMMSARADGPAFVDRMIEAGVFSFSLNIELFSRAAAEQHLSLKHAKTRHLLEPMLVRAVELLGRDSGRVRSLIIPGLEPAEETLAGIEWLAERGCHPVISPFRPARDIALSDTPPPAPAELTAILTEARAIVARHGVRLGPRCIPCQHNTLTFPWDVH